MSFNRRLGGGTQWIIAVAAAGLGTLATLMISNAINHAGWSPWAVVLAWIAIVAVATMLVKLRRTSLHGFDPRGADSRWGGPGAGEGGMPADGGG
jgi:hypothetical protein